MLTRGPGKPARSVQPLPRYTSRIFLKASGRWAYYFSPPTWARKAEENRDPRGPCPVGSETLHGGYAEAVSRVENVLLPLFDSWRTGGLSDLAADQALFGTLDWLFAEYRKSDTFRDDVSPRAQGLYERGFAMVGGYELKDGRRLGTIRLTALTTDDVDTIYRKLVRVPQLEEDGRVKRDADGEMLFVHAIDPETGKPAVDRDGRPVFEERRTTVNHAMKSCRRAWNVVQRKHQSVVPAQNPFSRMGLVNVSAMVPEAKWHELQAAIAAADAMGMPSLAAAFLATWEWLQREDHIFTAFRLEHYRPKEKPDEVYIIDPKTGESRWLLLFDKSNPRKQPVALYPELMARMDALKRDRIGKGLFFMRDWVDPRAGVPLPWVVGKAYLSRVSRKTRAVLRRAGVRDELTFTSFRHGGMTELGDLNLSDALIRAMSRHKSAKVLPRYVAQTQQQVVSGQRARLAGRAAQPKGGQR